MQTKNAPNYIIVGLALFAMFFGSGNLIFPLMLGRDAGSAFFLSTLGFIITAALIPFFGVLAMVYARGHYELLFKGFISQRLSKLFILIILLSFVPFGAGPRCVVLAHASLSTFLNMPPIWLFSAIFLLLVAASLYDKGRLIDLLGKILTPLLLFCVAVMVVVACLSGDLKVPEENHAQIFFHSLMEGYHTQDLLSSLFFSSSLILVLYQSFSDHQKLVRTTLKGGVLGVFLLVVVYALLMAAAALHSPILVGESGVFLVSLLAKATMGESLGLVAGIAVALACFTTAVALVLAFSEFLQKYFLPKSHARWALWISLAGVYGMSLARFEGIMSIMVPMMKVIYPFLFFLVLRFLFLVHKGKYSTSVSP